MAPGPGPFLGKKNHRAGLYKVFNNIAFGVIFGALQKQTVEQDMFNLILFGPPGSGKGTQSEKLIAQYGFKHLSTGDLLRAEIANRTPLGLEAKSLMDKGQLVPDEVVIGMISSALEANPGVPGFLFDGFPRTTAQAEALDKLLSLKGSSIGIVLFLQVPNEELISRMVNRAKTSGRSDDADPAVLQKRLDVYKRDTLPVSEHYGQLEKVVEIEGVGTVDD
ncbi:MAG TPA: adenylate kinase, partial [Chitinophagaceae bacterium]|nr:adenylate kinase [Chitinophagaceae bacterium]